jgi:hypothetical protein
MKQKKRRCKVCKTIFEPKQFLQATCDFKCAIEYSKILKANKEKLEWKKTKTILKDKLKTLTQFEAEAKKAFQKWIRLRDKDLPCISCTTFETDLFDGGHFKKAEIYSGVIFNEMNCHKQCRKCNRFLGGNELMYREGLVKRYGEQTVIELEQLANDTRQFKWSREQLIAKKLKYELLIKEYEVRNKD